MKLSKISRKILYQITVFYFLIVVGMGIVLFLDNLAFAKDQMSLFWRLYSALGFFSFLLTVGVPAVYLEKLEQKYGRASEQAKGHEGAKEINLFTKGHLIIGSFEFILHFSAYLFGILFMSQGPGISSAQVFQALSAGFAISLTFALAVTVLMRRNLQELARKTGFLNSVSEPKESYIGKLVSINAIMLVISVFVAGFISYSNGFEIMRDTQIEEMLQTGRHLAQYFEALDLENQRGISRAQEYLTRFFRDKHKEYLLIDGKGDILATNRANGGTKRIPFGRLKARSQANYKNSLLYYFPDFARGKIYAWRGVDGGEVYFVTSLDENQIASALIKSILGHGWVIVLVILFGILAIAFVTIDMVTPIRHLVKNALAISKGDLREPIQAETWDELLYLSKALESVRRGIAQMVYKIKESAKRIEVTADFIAETTNQEASGVVEYASSINEVLATLEELSVTAKKVSENASGVSGMSDKNLSRVEEGHQLIHEYMGQAQEIERKFQKSLDRLQDLNRRIQDISQIVELIETISGETKILSINASIESARGGENSRGFGVVAAEIRKLTDRVVSSTGAIRSNIREILAAADDTLEFSQKSWNDFQQQSRAIERLQKAFDEILNYSEKTAESAQQITDSIEQQFAATMQVNNTMQEISHVVKESSEMIQRTKEEVEDFSKMADDFLGLISAFQIREEVKVQKTETDAVAVKNPILEEEAAVL